MQNTLQYFRDYDAVTLEEAKKLKALGYSKKCNWWYLDKEDVPFVKSGLRFGEKAMNHNNYDEFIYSAPRRSDPDVAKLLG